MVALEMHTVRVIALALYAAVVLFDIISIIIGYAKYSLADNIQATPPVTTTPAPNDTMDYFLHDHDYEFRNLLKNIHRHPNSPHFYMVMPCVVSLTISCAILPAEIIFKTVFTSSFGVFMSFLMWFSHLIFMMMYFDRPYLHEKILLFFSSAMPAVGILHSIILLLLMAQMSLLGWYLKKQDVGWPCCKLGHLFTFETLLVTPRFVFSIIVASIYFQNHDYMDGIITSCYYYSDTNCNDVKASESTTYFIGAILFVNVLISTEAFMSTYLGVIHRIKSFILGTIMSIFLIIGIILCSDSYITYVYQQLNYSHELTGFGVTCIVFTVIHTILCFVLPEAISTPPNCIKILSKKNNPQTTERVLANGYGRLVATSGGFGQSQQMTTATLRLNFILFLVVTLNLILIAIERQFYCSMGESTLLATNVCVAIRTLTFLLTYKITGVVIPQPAVSLVLQFLMESIPMFIGVICVFISIGYTHHGIIIAPAVLSLIIVIFQGIVLTRNNTILGGQMMDDQANLVQDDNDSVTTEIITDSQVANNSQNAINAV